MKAHRKKRHPRDDQSDDQNTTRVTRPLRTVIESKENERRDEYGKSLEESRGAECLRRQTEAAKCSDAERSPAPGIARRPNANAIDRHGKERDEQKRQRIPAVG